MNRHGPPATSLFLVNKSKCIYESIGNSTLLGGVCRRRPGFEVCMVDQRASVEAGDLGIRCLNFSAKDSLRTLSFEWSSIVNVLLVWLRSGI
jgi:hypothetical protein